jgi:hypothetical protein
MPYNVDIPGWMTLRSLKIIEKWAKEIPPGGTLVEVGSFAGRSAWAWAKSVDPSVTVICIDRWEPRAYNPNTARRQEMFGTGKEAVECTIDTFRRNVADCPNIRAVKARSPYFPADARIPDKVDGVFLDERHKNPDFRDNLRFWSERLKPGGLLCGDDFHGNAKDVISEVLQMADEQRRLVWTYSFLWRFNAPGKETLARPVPTLERSQPAL